jgi:NADH-quinone oxidoreductase subunit L
MFLAAGVGAYSAAMFHMITHAFFKALLFLGAGSVIHGLHEEQDMRRMGALRKYMPITAGTFIAAWLAIAGIFPLSGFWSKDEILGAAWVKGDYALWAIGLVTALLTAFYMTRQVWLVFYTDARWDSEDSPDPAHAHREPHEGPWQMLLPLLVLAVLSVVGGVVDLPFTHANLDFLSRWLEPILAKPEVPLPSFATAFALSTVAVVVALVGIVAARAVYMNGLNADGTDPGAERLGPFEKVLANAYYLDIGLARFVSGPVTLFANFLSRSVDRGVIDGAVNGIGTLARRGGQGLRRAQTGLVRNYALGIAIGMFALLVYVTTRATF